MVKYLPSAQVTISGSWDGTRHQAPCSAGSPLLPLPLPFPPALAPSLFFLTILTLFQHPHLFDTGIPFIQVSDTIPSGPTLSWSESWGTAPGLINSPHPAFYPLLDPTPQDTSRHDCLGPFSYPSCHPETIAISQDTLILNIGY